MAAVNELLSGVFNGESYSHNGLTSPQNGVTNGNDQTPSKKLHINGDASQNISDDKPGLTVETPAAEAERVETVTAETPTPQAPAVETPAAEVPVVDAPAPDVPVAPTFNGNTHSYGHNGHARAGPPIPGPLGIESASLKGKVALVTGAGTSQSSL
jgi:hypothetical protein